jgi:hypothetical protein
MLSSNSTFVLRAENRCVCCGSDLESLTDLLNGLDFEVLSDSFETYPDNGHYLCKAEINNVWLGVIDAASDVLSAFAFLEGPRCCWIPFSHDTDNETQKVSKNKLLGPKPSLLI